MVQRGETEQNIRDDYLIEIQSNLGFDSFVYAVIFVQTYSGKTNLGRT